jgi:AraC family transcriptional regulator of adaptative response/methylated-DNA-[protein]-cysteine methyltransferase
MKKELDVAVKAAINGPVPNSLITITCMEPEEYKNGGEILSINYSFAESPFGALIIAATAKGISYMAFYDGGQEEAFAALKKQFPYAAYQQLLDAIQQNALFVFTQDWKKLNPISLHVKGTAFQFKVWEALLGIPMGQLSTYGAIAGGLQHPKASRAVGSAVGDNPVAFLIPCHRVVRSTGEIGQYHWGSARKTAIIGWEAARYLLTPKN